MNTKKWGTGIAVLLFAASAFAGTLFKYEDNGDWRTCFYRDGSVVTTLTVHVSQPCPQSD